MENDYERLINKDYLTDTMTFISFYIMTYENMVEYVTSQVHDFLCNLSVEENKIKYTETPEYKSKIKNKKVDENGNKNITKASFIWLTDNKAISYDDYECFLRIKQLRNSYAHELLQKVIQGVSKDEIDCFVKMILLYKKISNWWFQNIECQIMGYELSDEVDIESIQSDTTFLLDIIRNVIYNGKSTEYQDIIKAYKDGVENEV